MPNGTNLCTNLECSICKKYIKRNQNATSCSICNLWCHSLCASITNFNTENSMKWVCNFCINSELPFHSSDMTWNDIAPFESNTLTDFESVSPTGENNEKGLSYYTFKYKESQRKERSDQIVTVSPIVWYICNDRDVVRSFNWRLWIKYWWLLSWKKGQKSYRWWSGLLHNIE